MDDVRETFRRDGVVTLNGVLRTIAVESFREKIGVDLKASESWCEGPSTRHVDLTQSATWPKGSTRRVFEVVPSGCDKHEHWVALTSSPKLRGALDRILGVGAWELPLNARSEGKCASRYWYVPVVFPENVRLSDAAAVRCANIALGEQNAKSLDLNPSSSVLRSEVIEASERSRTSGHCQSSIHRAWSDQYDWTLKPVTGIYGSVWRRLMFCVRSRRTKTGRQVSSRGTMFSARSEMLKRTNKSNAWFSDCFETRQLSHGTCELQHDESTEHSTRKQFIPKSGTSRCWEPVNRRRMRGKGWHIDIGPRFQTTWSRKPCGHFNQGVIILVLLSDSQEGAGGTAFIRGSHRWIAEKIASHEQEGICHQELNSWATMTVLEAQRCNALNLDYCADIVEKSKSRLGIIEQAVYEAGTVILLHPWLIHSGTTNFGEGPRLMLNGMACLDKRIFNDTRGGNAMRDIDPICSTHFKLINVEDTNYTGKHHEAMQKSKIVHADQHAIQENQSGVSPECNFLKSTILRMKSLIQHADIASVMQDINSRESNDKSFPSVSIIIPVHNSIEWIEECLVSVIDQTYVGRIQVSLYDDASNDGSDIMIHAWRSLFQQFGISTVASGRCWGYHQNNGQLLFCNIHDYHSCHAGGIGHGKNMATCQSTGSYLLFLDADDVMFPTRLEKQLQLAAKNPGAILGGCWKRLPAGSTEHYESWANVLEYERLWLEQFREVTVQMPTWCMSRSVYDALGGFVESPPGDGEVGIDYDCGLVQLIARTCPYLLFECHPVNHPSNMNPKSYLRTLLDPLHLGEDFIFFQSFLDSFGPINYDGGHSSIARAGTPENPTLMYRW